MAKHKNKHQNKKIIETPSAKDRFKNHNYFQLDDFDFYQDLSKTAEASNNKDDYAYLSNKFSRYVPYIKRYKEAYPFLSNEELKDKLVADYFNILSPLIFISDQIINDYIDLETIRYFNDHTDEFEYYYEKVSSQFYDIPSKYTTFNDYKEKIARKMYNLYEGKGGIKDIVNSQINPEISELIKKSKFPDIDKDETVELFQKIVDILKNDSSLDANNRRNIINYLKIYFLGPTEMLKNAEKNTEKKLHKYLSKSSLEIIRTLKDLGAYDYYVNTNKKHFKNFKFREFIEDEETHESQYVSIEDLPKALEKMSLDDLVVLNSFWINRYAKELGNYSEALFIIHNLGCIDELLEGKRITEIMPIDVFTQLNTKRLMLQPLIKEYILKRTSNSPEEDEKYHDTKTMVLECDDDIKFYYNTFEYDELQERVSADSYKSAYTPYFESVFPNCKNDPEQDILLYAHLLNPIMCAYDQKDRLIYTTLLQIALNKDEHRNIGIIPDKISEDGTKAFFEGSMYNLGLDSQSTYFVKEHTPHKIVKSIFNFTDDHVIIPIYDGSKDFTDETNSNSTFISSQLVLPFSEQQKEILEIRKRRIENQDSVNPKIKNFINHLYYLSNPSELPEHFYTKDFDSKGNPLKYYRKRYVDLATGRIYVKDLDGHYIPVQPNNIMRSLIEGEEK